MSSDLQQALRRLKPQKRLVRIVPRSSKQLHYLGRAALPDGMLFDTTVYVDLLQGRFRDLPGITLNRAGAWHCSSALAELASAFGHLQPGDPRSRETWFEVEELFARIPAKRVLTPGPPIWLEAGILSGLLGRVAQYPLSDRRRVLNDSLIFATARKYGLSVLTRNVRDFDLLQQLDPSGRVLFYQRV